MQSPPRRPRRRRRLRGSRAWYDFWPNEMPCSPIRFYNPPPPSANISSAIMRFILTLLLVFTCVSAAPATRPAEQEMILINGGSFKMGTNDGFPFEGPVHEVTLRAFWIDTHEVTVGQFEKFVAATNYKTDAEKFGWSGVFDLKSG